MKRIAASLALGAALGAGFDAEAAETYCNDAAGLVKAYVERQNLKRKLHQRGYAEVEAFYSGLQRDYEAGARGDAHLAAWFVAFEDADPRLAAAIQEWVRQYPGSYAARRALAGHHYAVAWERRGDRYRHETSEAQYAGMRSALRSMMEALDAADGRTAKPIASFPLRIYGARMLGDATSVREPFEKAERLDPRNTEAKAAMMGVSSAKWHGPPGQLEELIARVKSTRPVSEDFIRYMGYHASMVVGEMFDTADKRDEAIAQYERATRNCEAYVAPLERLARLYKATGREAEARAAAGRALDLYQQAYDYGDRSLQPRLERLRREAGR